MIWFLRVALIDSFIFDITDVTKNPQEPFQTSCFCCAYLAQLSHDRFLTSVGFSRRI